MMLTNDALWLLELEGFVLLLVLLQMGLTQELDLGFFFFFDTLACFFLNLIN